MTGERGPEVELAYRELQRLRPDPWILVSRDTAFAALDTAGVTDPEAVDVFERLADRVVKSSPLGYLRTMLRAVVADRPPDYYSNLTRAEQPTLDETQRELVREMMAFFQARKREVGVSQARAETEAKWPEAVES